jgi:hypothetical protein
MRGIRAKRVIFTQVDNTFMAVGRGTRQNAPVRNGNNDTGFVIGKTNL